MRVVYGINPVTEALKSGSPHIEAVLISAGRADKAIEAIIKTATQKSLRISRVDNAELAKIAGTSAHQGVALIFSGDFSYVDIDDLLQVWKASAESAFFLVLDSVQDPQNLGSLIRAACAAGLHGVIIPKDRACEVTPAVAKASAGATEHVKIARETNITRAIERLKKENIWVAAIEADASGNIFASDLKRDIALVIGGEAKGIRRLVRETCDFALSIPLKGKLNSLNAAQAGAIAMFEVLRQRL